GRWSETGRHPCDRPWSAAVSCCATGSFAGLTAGGAASGAGVQDPSPATAAHTCSASVQGPSATPSGSPLAAPSVHGTAGGGIPLNATKQSVAAGPPPATQSGGQSAKAIGAAKRTRKRAAERIGAQRSRGIRTSQPRAAEPTASPAERSGGTDESSGASEATI